MFKSIRSADASSVRLGIAPVRPAEASALGPPFAELTSVSAKLHRNATHLKKRGGQPVAPEFAISK